MHAFPRVERLIALEGRHRRGEYPAQSWFVSKYQWPSCLLYENRCLKSSQQKRGRAYLPIRPHHSVPLLFTRLRKSECNVNGAWGRLGISRPTGRDHDVLFAIDHISGRRGHAGERKLRFPQQFSCAAVERPDLAVEVGGGNNHQSSGRHNGTTVVLGARILQSPWRLVPDTRPRGSFHRYLPVFKSMALSVPHGGATAG